MKFELYLDKYSWSRSGSTWLCGDCYIDSKPVSVKQIESMIKSVESLEQILERLSILNGFYALVIKNQSHIICCVDQIRSYPLFYQKSKHSVIITDDPKEITTAYSLNQKAISELRCTGFVTNNETIINDLFQIRAGDAIVITNSDINKYSVYDYYPSYSLKASKSKIFDMFDNSLSDSFEIVNQYTMGSRVVVPLSTGYDSRLLLYWLSEAGVDNVLCVHYSRSGSDSIGQTRDLADTFSYEWKHVEYNSEKWVKHTNTESFKKYFQNAGRYSSLPHLQDWLAIKLMEDNNELNKDDIIIPGHGVFAIDSHITIEIFKLIGTNFESLAKFIYEEKYGFDDSINFETAEMKIKKAIHNPEIGSRKQLVREFQYWEWKERQSKYLANSVRIYEHFGYDWWLPFWSKNYMDTWERIPLDQRMKKKIHKQYVREKFKQNGLPTLNSTQTNETILHLIKNKSEENPLFHPIIKYMHDNLYPYIENYINPSGHVYGMDGILKNMDQEYTGSLNTGLLQAYVNSINNEY